MFWQTPTQIVVCHRTLRLWVKSFACPTVRPTLLWRQQLSSWWPTSAIVTC